MVVGSLKSPRYISFRDKQTNNKTVRGLYMATNDS